MQVARLTLRAAVDWAIASPPEASRSQNAKGHPMTRAIYAAMLLVLPARLPPESLASAEEMFSASCDLAAWLATADSWAPPGLIVPQPPVHGAAVCHTLLSIISGFGALRDRRRISSATAERLLNVILQLLRRMLDEPEEATGWSRLMYEITSRTLRTLLKHAMPPAASACQEACLSLVRSALAANEPQQRGSRQTAIAQSLPCWVAALSSSTSALASAGSSRQNDSCRAGITAILQAYHQSQALLNLPSSRKSILDVKCEALQCLDFPDQDTRCHCFALPVQLLCVQLNQMSFCVVGAQNN